MLHLKLTSNKIQMIKYNDRVSVLLQQHMEENVRRGFIDLEDYLRPLHSDIVIFGGEMVLNDKALAAFKKSKNYEHSVWNSINEPIPIREAFDHYYTLKRRRSKTTGYYEGFRSSLSFQLISSELNHEIPDIYFERGIERTRQLIDELDEFELPFTTNIVDKTSDEGNYVIHIFSLILDERVNIER